MSGIKWSLVACWLPSLCQIPSTKAVFRRDGEFCDLSEALGGSGSCCEVEEVGFGDGLAFFFIGRSTVTSAQVTFLTGLVVGGTGGSESTRLLTTFLCRKLPALCAVLWGDPSGTVAGGGVGSSSLTKRPGISVSYDACNSAAVAESSEMRRWREAAAFAIASLVSIEALCPGGRSSSLGVEGAGEDGAAFPVAVLLPSGCGFPALLVSFL